MMGSRAVDCSATGKEVISATNAIEITRVDMPGWTRRTHKKLPNQEPSPLHSTPAVTTARILASRRCRRRPNGPRVFQ